MKAWKVDYIVIGPAVDAEVDPTNDLLEECLNGHEKANHCIKEIIKEKEGHYRIIYTVED